MKYRRLCLALACFLLWLAIAPLSLASEPIRVGIPSGGGADVVLPSAGHRAMLLDSVAEIAKYANWDISITEAPEATLRAMLAGGELDLMGGVYYSAALEGEVLYPRHVSGYAYAVLVANPGDDTIVRNDFRSMEGARIATVAGSSESGRLLGYLALNNIQSTIVYVKTMAEAQAMLQRGDVEMALVGDENAYGYRAIMEFVIGPYYLVAAPGREDLIGAVDEAYARILDTDPSFIESLYGMHFSAAKATATRLTDAERSAVEKASPLRVALFGNAAPLQAFDDQGEASGILVDLLALLHARTGLDFTLLQAEDIPAALAMAQAGEADAVLGLYAADTNIAKAGLTAVQPLLQSSTVVLCSKQAEYPSEGMRLALMPGMEFLVDSFTGELVYADSFLDCASLVNNGMADYTYVSTYVLEYGTQNRAFQNAQLIVLPNRDDRLTMGMTRPVDPALLAALNKAINSITDDELQDVVLRNTAMQVQNQSLQALIYAYPLVFVGVLLGFLVLIIAVTIIFALLRSAHTRALHRTQYMDSVTGALNLAGLRHSAPRLLASAAHYALSYASIRSFQYFNDRFGFEEGDAVLRKIADVYRAFVADGELFCRIGGGSFAALLQYDSKEGLFERLDRLHCALSSITPRADSSYHIKMADGIYLSEPGKPRDIFSMIDRANIARQQIRSSSMQEYVVYREGFFDTIAHTQALESRMDAALAAGEFVVYLQPKINLSTMKPGGAEALVRWIDDGHLVPPDEFIPYFERNGFIALLDRYVFEQCCLTLRRWMDTGMPVVPISINVSRVQLYAQDFLEQYIAIKQRHAIPDGLLELEFTESILFEDVNRLIEIVGALHANGFACSIDDFGKGYSSLTMLKNIPADIIKLDAQFFSTGLDEQRDTLIIESVVDIARSLRMTSIAEGIEHKRQVKLLQMIGCDMAQGYLFSRPIPIAAFERYLAEKLQDGADPYAAQKA